MQGYFVSVSKASWFETPQQFFSAHVFGQQNNNLSLTAANAITATRGNEGKPVALIVDDVADVTEMLSVFLSMSGYETVTADSASAAIEAARSRHFDVVISDIGMPQINGYELAETLRAIPGYESVPLVAVTGYSMYDDRERSLRSGFNAHLTKPIDPNVLFQLIERLRG